MNGQAGGEPPVDLFAPAPERDDDETDVETLLGPFGKRARLVRIKADAMASVFSESTGTTSRRVSLNLFPSSDAKQTILAEGAEEVPVDLIGSLDTEETEGDTRAFFGRVEGDDGSSFSIVVVDDIFTLDLNSPKHGIFEVSLHEEETMTYVVRELDAAGLPDCGVDDPEWDEDQSQKDTLRSKDEDSLSTNAASAQEDGSVIDLMVLYTTAVKTALNGARGVRTRIECAVRAGNWVLRNSGLQQEIRLVHVEEVPRYRERSGKRGYYTMLDHLVAGNVTGLRQVHGLRDRYRADIVALLVTNPSLGSLANVMLERSTSFASRAYNVTNYVSSRSTFTLVHEIAHNIGCCHETNCRRATLRYSRGYILPGNTYKTVMVRMRAPGSRIPYFSNPNVNYRGRATGVAENRDNARVIRENARTVANFRTRVEDKVS